MPKASQKSRRRDNEAEANSQAASQSSRPRRHVEDGNEENYSQSQQSQAKNALSKDELERKVPDLVRFMLFMDAKKTPVKRGDITKNVLKEHSRSFPLVLAEAQKKIKKTFGFELIEADHNKQKVYFLVNTMPSEQREIIESAPEEVPKMGLLLVILGIIFMKDNDVGEDLLWQTLKRLGVFKGKVHETFSDVEKLISVEFVRQMYLDRKKFVAGDTATYHYSWGLRAQNEVSKRNVLQMVADVYETDIEAWSAKYREVLEDEERMQQS